MKSLEMQIRQQLVKIWTRPSRDGKSYVHYLLYNDLGGKRRFESLGHGDRKKAEKQRLKKEKELLATTKATKKEKEPPTTATKATKKEKEPRTATKAPKKEKEPLATAKATKKEKEPPTTATKAPKKEKEPLATTKAHKKEKESPARAKKDSQEEKRASKKSLAPAEPAVEEMKVLPQTIQISEGIVVKDLSERLGIKVNV